MSGSTKLSVTSIEEIKQNITNFNHDNEYTNDDNVIKISYKEDEFHMIIYSENNQRSGNYIDDETKSIIIDKTTLQPIVTQFNKLYYNGETEDFLYDKNWNDVVVKKCFEGTMIIVFYSHDKWYVCTRKCLDAKKSYWIHNMSYYDLFMESINDKFALEDLDKNLCYHFILIHYLNKNIVDYSVYGEHYKLVALAMTTEKHTFQRVQYHINDKVLYPDIMKFNNIIEAQKALRNISDGDMDTYNISTEGFIIEHYNNGKLTLLKLQTPIYNYISSVKPNVSNCDEMFLELYQYDNLVSVVPYFSDHCSEVVNRIHSAVKTMSMEILNFYHLTRSHKNEELYESLPSSYKTALYKIHGLYLYKIKKENEKLNNAIVVDEFREQKSITVHDVYICLKQLEPYVLRKMFTDRLDLLDKHDKVLEQILIENSIESYIQGKLMTRKED